MKEEYEETESNLRIFLEKEELENGETYISSEDVNCLLCLLYQFPNGVHTMQDSQMAESCGLHQHFTGREWCSGGRSQHSEQRRGAARWDIGGLCKDW